MAEDSNPTPRGPFDFSGGPTTGTPPPATVSPELTAAAQRVADAIDEVKAAQASGDFTRYGKALTDLEAANEAFLAAQRAATNRPVGTTPTATPTPATPTSPPATPQPG